MLQQWDTMSLIKVDLGSVCSVSMGTSWYTFTHPNRATLYLLYTSLCMES